MKVRLFMGFDLSENVRNIIAQDIEHLKSIDQGAMKWVTAQNLHVTFIFLGSIEIERISEIKQMMKQVTAGFLPFTLHLKKAGFFPNERFFKIIYQGVEESSQKIREMYQEMKEALLGSQFEVEERDFVPHITLGRVRLKKDSLSRLSEEIKHLKDKKADWQVSGLTLYQSDLKGPEPCYEALFVSPLVSKVKN